MAKKIRRYRHVQGIEHQTARFSMRKTVIVFVLICIVVGVLAHWMSSPSRGHAIKVDERTAVATPVATSPVLPASTLNTSYFSLSLPPGYSSNGDSSGDPSLLFARTIIKPGAEGSLIITAALKPLPSGGLSGDSSYQLRVTKPNQYLLTEQAVSGDRVTIANDTQSSDIVAFWPHGAYEATISISEGFDDPAQNNNQDLINALQPLLSAWHWK